MSTNTDYQRVAKAIQFIDQHLEQQPSLEDIADQLSLSSFHCQRLFQRWAGISPKRFTQFLTLEYAKQLLAESKDGSVLEASYAAGLSGPSRLHDHFVTLEAATPGEYKNGGEQLTIRYGVHKSPFGDMFIAVTTRGVCKLSFMGEFSSLEDELIELTRPWPNAALKADQSATANVAENLFDTTAKQPLTLWVKGTNFQINVWKALLAIPAGQLSSYDQVARAIDNPKAVRAVGQAIGANPIAYLIPCHRVIRSVGTLGGYRWDATRKRALIAWEAAQRSAAERHSVGRLELAS